MNSGAPFSDASSALRCDIILESAPDSLIVFDRGNRVRIINRRTETLSGFARGELLGRPIKTLVAVRHGDHPADDLDHLLESAWSGSGADRIDLNLLRKDGINIPVEMSFNHVDTGGTGYLVASLIDITRHMRDEDAQQHMTALVDSAEDAIVTKTLDGIVRSWNAAAEKLLGYAAKEIIGTPVTRLIPEDRQHEETLILGKIRAGERVAHFETVRRRRDGSLVEVSLMISPLRDRSGTIVGASKIMRDLTDRNATLAQLRTLNSALEQQIADRTAQLREREAMLQEIHHRVKNNLQVITSLINMQMRSLADIGTRAALRQCHSRIATMAQIHEMLYQAQDYAQLPFARYAQELVRRMMDASAAGTGSVAMHFEMDELLLPVDIAIPCGLILHELVSNAFKHAFSPEGGGGLWVSLRRSADKAVLAVRDDGPGLPADFDIARRTSLGLTLVTILTDQIDGELEFLRQSGTTFRVTFPLAAPA